jgi:hypothetical protein
MYKNDFVTILYHPMYMYLVVHEGLEATDALMHYPTQDGIFPGKVHLTARPHGVQENV